MPTTLVRASLATLLVSFSAAAAPAQQPFGAVDPAGLPACADLGLARVALTVPPGRTQEEVQASIQRGEIVEAGVEALILPRGRLPNLVNPDHMRSRASSTLWRILQRLQVDGAVSMLLEIDVDGLVTGGTANSGNRELDGALARLWREAQFTPMAFGGCRVPAWVHIPLYFTSDFSLRERRIQMHIAEPPAAAQDR